MQETLQDSKEIVNLPEKKTAFNVQNTSLPIKPQEQNGTSAELPKEKRHRRSKNDQEGRKYVCDICQKSYLSPPALSSHRKNKHFQNEAKKGRGRPRKYPIASSQNQKEQDMYDAFFTDPKRQRKPEETYDLKGSVLKIIKEIQSKEKGIIFKGEPENVENINLYVLMNTENLPVNLESADDAFSRYLKECYTKSSEEYFVKIVQFVSLFRDFLNCKNQGENKEDIYSIKKGAMKLPDSCNEFVSDFVEKKHQLGIEVTDCIDLIQHFCFWLHQNKYTKSILSLLVDN